MLIISEDSQQSSRNSCELNDNGSTIFQEAFSYDQHLLIQTQRQNNCFQTPAPSQHNYVNNCQSMKKKNILDRLTQIYILYLASLFYKLLIYVILLQAYRCKQPTISYMGQQRQIAQNLTYRNIFSITPINNNQFLNK